MSTDALREAVDDIVVRALASQQAFADVCLEEPDSEEITRAIAKTICESLGITYWLVADVRGCGRYEAADALAALLTLAEIKK